MSEQKRCPKCGETKARDDYYKDGSKHDGLSTMCQACKRKCAVAYYAAHKEERAAYAAAYWRDYGKKRP